MSRAGNNEGQIFIFFRLGMFSKIRQTFKKIKALGNLKFWIEYYQCRQSVSQI